MEKFTQKWAIISLLEDANEGAEFHYTEFPLHITLAGVFAIDKKEHELIDDLTTLLTNVREFQVIADENDYFGPNKDIAVTKIQQTPDLIDLHEYIHEWLVHAGARFNAPHYQGAGYAPHATFQKSGRLMPGEARTLSSVSLIDLFPDGNGYQRKITKTIDLLQ